MKYVTKQFEAKSWQTFVDYAFTHCPDVLLVLRDRKGRQLYTELAKARLLPAKESLSISICEVPWPTRVEIGLRCLGIQTLGDLVSKSKADLLRCRNFGHKSLQAVTDVLDRYGLSLRLSIKDKTPDSKQDIDIKR